MEGSIKLSSPEHKIALGIYRGGGDARVARRAHVLLLLNAGMSFRQIMEITFCSSDLVAGVKQRFLAGGVEAAVAEPTENDTMVEAVDQGLDQLTHDEQVLQMPARENSGTHPSVRTG